MQPSISVHRVLHIVVVCLFCFREGEWDDRGAGYYSRIGQCGRQSGGGSVPLHTYVTAACVLAPYAVIKLANQIHVNNEN